MPSVTIVIPVFNNWNLTQECLTSIARHTEDVAVTIVDNGSTDETDSACPCLGQNLFGDDFYFLRFPENCSFGPASTAGARLAKTDLVLFLNNDIVVTPNWLPPLLKTLASDPMLAGVGPLMLYPDGSVQHLGITFWPLGEPMGHLYRHLPGAHPLTRKKRRFQALSAAALLLPRRDFIQAGGFPTGYINGLEDIDLCLQLTRGGRYMTCVPESVICHQEAQTECRYDHDDANMQLLIQRHKLFIHGDLDVLVAQDGFTLNVLPNLDICIGISPEKDMALRSRLGKPFSEQRCRELLGQEPFWNAGYELLGTYLEDREQFDAALQLYIMRSSLNTSPSLADYERTLYVTRKLGKSTALLETEWNNALSSILDITTFQARLERALYFLRSGGRKDLADKYIKAAMQARDIREKGIIHFV